MRTIFRYIAALSVAALAFASCQKENLVQKVNEGPAVQGGRVITVSFGTETKSAIGEDGVTPKFQNGDKIWVANTDGTGTAEECTITVSGETATFTTNLTTGPLTAVYPSSAVKKNSENVNKIDGFIVPAVQTGKFADANICMAEAAADASSMTFHNKTAVLRYYVDASIGVTSVKVESSSTVLNTEGADDAAKKVITVDPAGDTQLHTVTDDPKHRICYIAVLSGVSVNTLTLTGETTTQGTVTKTLTSTSTLQAGHIYNAFLPYYIDLGTAGKWGYCNVGAFLPEEYGDYYVWGATVKAYSAVDYEKTTGAFTFVSSNPYGDIYKNTWNASDGFSWNNTPFTDGVYSNGNKKVFTKYVPEAKKSNYGDGSTFYDNIDVLDSEDDVAHKVLGGTWRMPTKEAFNALAQLNKQRKTDYNGTSGVNGYLFTDGNGNSIFLPAAGYGSGTCLYSVGSGFYWSSSLDTSYPDSAYSLNLYGGNANTTSSYFRCFGQSVRALYKEPTY